MLETRKTKAVGVKLPDALLQHLRHHAIDNRRSLDDEIQARLEESITQQNEARHKAKKNN